MRVFVAGLKTETNSWVSRPTRLEDFESFDPAYFEVLRHQPPRSGSPRHQGYSGFLAAADAAGAEVMLGPARYATPGGAVKEEVVAELFGGILSSLAAALPVDLVLLDLHGAMMSSVSDDCEGDLLEEVSRIAGKGAIIAALLDPHASLSDRMLKHSDLLHCYKEYPHTDVYDRAGELFRHAHAALNGVTRPCAAVYECGVLGAFPTVSGPMRAFVDRLMEEEGRPGVISVSLVHGFPWSNSAANGAKALVYSNGHVEQAEALAVELGEEFRRIARTAAVKELPVKEGVERLCSETASPVIVADTSDNPGGGGDADATFVFEALLAAGRFPIGVAVVCDPASFDACMQAGVGAELELDIGGKAAATSGTPLHLKVRVEAITDQLEIRSRGSVQHVARGFIRVSFDRGDIILSRERQEALWPELFTALGSDPADYAVILLKSSNHFRAGFNGYSDAILSIGSPAAMNPQLADLAFTRLTQPVWPIVDWDMTRPHLVEGVETRSHD
ncbi:MAG TPA: M81 family metallopeptidase [Hyphomonas sp.]|nr:M81 family metallopeptidase [Hyphomonas sp.]